MSSSSDLHYERSVSSHEVNTLREASNILQRLAVLPGKRDMSDLDIVHETRKHIVKALDQTKDFRNKGKRIREHLEALRKHTVLADKPLTEEVELLHAALNLREIIMALNDRLSRAAKEMVDEYFQEQMKRNEFLSGIGSDLNALIRRLVAIIGIHHQLEQDMVPIASLHNDAHEEKKILEKAGSSGWDALTGLQNAAEHVKMTWEHPEKWKKHMESAYQALALIIPQERHFREVEMQLEGWLSRIDGAQDSVQKIIAQCRFYHLYLDKLLNTLHLYLNTNSAILSDADRKDVKSHLYPDILHVEHLLRTILAMHESVMDEVEDIEKLSA